MTLTRLSNKWPPSFPSLIDRFFEGNVMDWANSNYSATNPTLPRVNIKEGHEGFLIEIAAPGMKKEDFKISLDNGKLTISSEVEEKVPEGEKFIRREFSYQSFKRTFDISQNLIDGNKINAKYVDGILYIALPKREEVKPKPAKEIVIV